MGIGIQASEIQIDGARKISLHIRRLRAPPHAPPRPQYSRVLGGSSAARQELRYAEKSSREGTHKAKNWDWDRCSTQKRHVGAQMRTIVECPR